MQPRTFPPLVEAFLIIDQPRQRLSHWVNALSALDEGRAPPLAVVAAHYDPTTDQAVLGLKYDELAMGPERLAFVVETALLAEIGMIQPAELSEGDRRRFLGERLARCTLTVNDQRTVVGALTELVRRIREQKLSPKTVIAVPIRPTPPGRSLSRPDLPVVNAKGTRDDLRQATSRFASDPSMKRVTGSDPELQAVSAIQPPGIIYARYLRSGRWVPVRIGSLSLKGAALMSGALPRVADQVDIALSYADHRALVRGPVTKVSTAEETALTGTATFTVAFQLDDTGHRQLTTLLTHARANQVTIRPPPPRGTRRYPVEWPVCLGTMRGAIRGEALDLSRDGMFVRPLVPLQLASSLNFSVILDDNTSPVSGRAKVVRHITDTEARVTGLTSGFGLQISDMPALDRERWNDFIARIAKRADKRVLVGASPERLRELQAALIALGYAVTGGTDPKALAQLAGAAHPVDAVLLDGGWLSPTQSAEWIESMFTARNVPCVRMTGDARRGRAEIDRVLTVV